MLNRILRFKKHPFEVHYIQPFVADLYNFIRDSFVQKHERKFKCYRGAYLAQEEIDKIKKAQQGEIIQCLGFMSTSTNKKTALTFATNVLIIIDVDDGPMDEDYEPGYIS